MQWKSSVMLIAERCSLLLTPNIVLSITFVSLCSILLKGTATLTLSLLHCQPCCNIACTLEFGSFMNRFPIHTQDLVAEKNTIRFFWSSMIMCHLGKFCWLVALLALDSDDDFRSGCRNVSQCHNKQYFSRLHSPG